MRRKEILAAMGMPADVGLAPAPVQPLPNYIAEVMQEKTPCDACKSQLRCQRQKTACMAFSLYLDGFGLARWRWVPRQSTRARYKKIMGK
jgi:hypothetical protein